MPGAVTGPYIHQSNKGRQTLGRATGGLQGRDDIKLMVGISGEKGGVTHK